MRSAGAIGGPGTSNSRCAGCGLSQRWCFCSEITPFDTRTRVQVILHTREVDRPSNSGRLIRMALTQGQVRARAARGGPSGQPQAADPDRRSLLLFPFADAPLLTRELVEADPRPITLVVPDGTWAQARRVGRREPGLAEMECVQLPVGERSRYRLRWNPDPARISTCEAAARALGIIEGPAARDHLEAALELMVARVRYSRGR